MLPNRSKIAEVKSGRVRPSLTFISLVIYITHSCTVSVFNSVIVKILRWSYHSLSSVFPQKLTNLTVISFKSSSTQAAVSLACETGLAGCIVFATVIDTFVLEKKDTWSKMHSLTAAYSYLSWESAGPAAEREVAGSDPGTDKHSGSLINWGESAAFAMTSTNGLRKGTKREFGGSKSPLLWSLFDPFERLPRWLRGHRPRWCGQPFLRCGVGYL